VLFEVRSVFGSEVQIVLLAAGKKLRSKEGELFTSKLELNFPTPVAFCQ
jgi:hypothetical protein